MSATIGFTTERRPFYLAVILGLACAFLIGKALPSTMDVISAIIEPLCASSDPTGSTQSGSPLQPLPSWRLRPSAWLWF